MTQRLLFLLLSLIALLPPLAAQERTVQHRPYIDERRFHYGFLFGLHDQGLGITNNGLIDGATGAQWVAANDRHNYGFTVGVLGEWRLTPHLSLRAIPLMTFGSKHIAYRNLADGSRESQDMKSTYIGVAFHIKAAAPRFNNFRPYVVAGVAPMFDLTANKHTLLRTKQSQMMIEAGMGCDLYLPFFKLIPELKFSFCPSNVLQKNRHDLTDATQQVFTQSVDKLTTSMVTLTFYFE